MTGRLRPEEAAALAAVDEAALLELAVRLVAAAGENPPGEEAASAQVLACAGRALGLQVELQEVAPGRPNVRIVLPGGDRPGLLLLGHTDVVPVGPGWTVPPFGALVRDGRLYGRGSADMKGGLAACLAAMAALRGSRTELAGPVELVATVDEEESGLGVQAHLGSQPPAGGGPARFAGCVVAEPTDLQTIAAARGDSYLEITVHGRAAHSGRPADGLNAVHAAARIVTELERWHEELLAGPAHPLAGPPTFSVGRITGGSGTSTVPARCQVSVDRRLAPAEDAGAVLAEVWDRLRGLGLEQRGYRVEVELGMQMPGFDTPVESRLVRTADAAVSDAGGPGLPVGGWTAACDGGYVARDAGVPVVVLGAGSVADQAHRPDESVAVHDLVVAARAYALTGLRLLGTS